ncbi:ABC transporter substrate-binding protein [Cryobacterium sp. Y50]|uniref:ABC transporter substrate-binding protein n=1 Tax=Cryobacterium sp. Y50 TaxID=2048286 RepID=UPI001304A17A|nr:ABC transporter substrate-binding protein [Cryobacterium sp. Y50]
MSTIRLPNAQRRSLSRRVVAAAVAAASLSLILSSCSSTAPDVPAGDSPAELTPLSLQLGWLIDDGIAGEAVALSKGWYEEAGIDLKINAGGPSLDGVALVSSGASDIGQLSSSPSLMLARSQGIPVQAFAAGLQKHPYTFFSLAENAVTEPHDLIGKTVGVQATGQVLLQAVLAANDIDPSDVTVQVVGSEITPLTTGAVDVWTGWATTASIGRTLGEVNKDYFEMALWDAGVQLYPRVYYATESTLADKPETLETYLEVTSRGWEYAYANLDEAAAAVAALAPGLDAGIIADGITIGHTYEAESSGTRVPWGSMDPDVWAKQLDTWESLGLFPNAVPALDDVIDTTILDETKDTRVKMSDEQ